MKVGVEGSLLKGWDFLSLVVVEVAMYEQFLVLLRYCLAEPGRMSVGVNGWGVGHKPGCYNDIGVTRV